MRHTTRLLLRYTVNSAKSFGRCRLGVACLQQLPDNSWHRALTSPMETREHAAKQGQSVQLLASDPKLCLGRGCKCRLVFGIQVRWESEPTTGQHQLGPKLGIVVAVCCAGENTMYPGLLSEYWYCLSSFDAWAPVVNLTQGTP